MFKNVKYIAYEVKDGAWNVLGQNLSSADIDSNSILPTLNIALMVPQNAVCLDLDFGHVDNWTDWNECALKIIEKLNRDGVRYYCCKTDRGYHLYFRNPPVLGRMIKSVTGHTCAAGLHPIDYKVGLSGDNKMTIRKNGKFRDWLKLGKDPEVFDEMEIDILPDFLREIGHNICLKGTSEIISVWKLNGGSRNDTLFTLGLHCGNSKRVDMSNLESILQFTNSLFAKPLLPSEVVNIAISASKMSYKTITNFTIDTANPEYHTIYSKYLIDTYQATRVEGMEYLYDEKHKLYVTTDLFDETGERFLEKEILSLTPKFMSRERSEVCKAFHLMVSDSPMLDLKPSDLVSCTNGLLSGQGKLISHTSLLFANHALGIDYNPKAYDKFVDGYLNERFCEAQYGGDPEQRLIFEELLGGALFDYRDNQKKGLIIFGTSGNTKSKLLDAIARFMGRSFVSTLGLTKIREGEDKQIIQLVGKKINIDQDMYEGTWKSDVTTALKKFIGSGDTFSLRPLYQAPKEFRIKTKFWGATNKLPKLADYEDAIFNRWVILRAGKGYSDYFDGAALNKDGNLTDMLSTTKAKEYFLRLAVEGWKRYCKNGFTVSKASILCTDLWRKSASAVATWIEEHNLKAVWFHEDKTFTDIAKRKNKSGNSVYACFSHDTGKMGEWISKTTVIDQILICFKGEVAYDKETGYFYKPLPVEDEMKLWLEKNS